MNKIKITRLKLKLGLKLRPILDTNSFINQFIFQEPIFGCYLNVESTKWNPLESKPYFVECETTLNVE